MTCKFSFSTTLVILLFLVATCRLNAGKPDPAAEGAQILARARSVLSKTDASPYSRTAQLKVSFGLKSVHGRYLIASTGSSWREEVDLPGLSETRVTAGSSVRINRFSASESLPTYWLFFASKVKAELQLLPEETFSRITNEKISGRVVRCVEMRPKGFAVRQVCTYEDDDTLASFRKLGVRIDFSEYADYGNAKFPRRVRAFDTKIRQDFFEAVFDPPTPLAGGTINLNLAANAELGWCAELLPSALVNQIPPHYPRGARESRTEGTVAVHGVLDVDGRLKMLSTVMSAGPYLDQATLEAVSQWSYRPAMCANVPVRSEEVVIVNYQLGY